MLNTILNLMTEFTAVVESVSSGNPMIAGALTLFLTGSAGYLVKSIPSKVLSLVKRQLITELTVNNGGQRNENPIDFFKISNFITQQSTEVGSRTLATTYKYEDGGSKLFLYSGYGLHVFFYKGRVMWARKNKLDSSGSEKVKEEITLYKLGRSYDLFSQLMVELSDESDLSKIDILQWGGYSWDFSCSIVKTPLSSLAMAPDVRETIDSTLTHFKSSKDEYRLLGLPYKLSILMASQPGTGKTSIIRAIASDYNMKIHPINLASMTDKSLSNALRVVDPGSLVIFEDFDSSGATHKRGDIVNGIMVSDDDEDKKDFSPLTLSGILNALDGVASLDDVVCIFTTNCVDKIDPAILRAGRMDLRLDLGPIPGEAVKEHLESIYGVFEGVVPDMLGKDINGVKFNAKMDKQKMLELLKEFK